MVDFLEILSEIKQYLYHAKDKNEQEVLHILSTLMVVSAFITFVGMRITNVCAAYGRHASASYFTKVCNLTDRNKVLILLFLVCNSC